MKDIILVSLGTYIFTEGLGSFYGYTQPGKKENQIWADQAFRIFRMLIGLAVILVGVLL